MSEYITKAPIEPRDYRVVFLIQKRHLSEDRCLCPCVRRFELPTPWSVAKCSIQLSYAHIFY